MILNILLGAHNLIAESLLQLKCLHSKPTNLIRKIKITRPRDQRVTWEEAPQCILTLFQA